ncbi:MULTISPECIES: hypothetical protein [unclassified Listeria]|uniref:hypothetical protein n=1 Tax=unclassified Listeria TaxID=2642072 RepID=UPI000B5922EE|nr:MULTISPECIES: hypothetical protein [unclassified Listeria]
MISIIQVSSEERVQEALPKLNTAEGEFILLNGNESDIVTSQIMTFAKNYEEVIASADIHYFQKNPVFLKEVKNFSYEKTELEEGLNYINEVELSVPSYLEQEPFLIFEENYHFMLVRKKELLSAASELDGHDNFEELMFRLLSKNQSIVKQKILEFQDDVFQKELAEVDVEQVFEKYAFLKMRQEKHSHIRLLNQKYNINTLNYLVREQIGPYFQQLILKNEVAKAETFLTSLLKKLEQLDKIIVSDLVSLGYFFVQVPIENYQNLKSDPLFVETYLKFSTFLFDQMHFNSRQYYLRFYRQTTNALYKAVRANSDKELQKCNELFFSK